MASPSAAASEAATRTWRREGPWLPRVREECEAVRDAAGILDLPGFSRFVLEGPGAGDWLSGQITGRVPRPGRLGLAYFADEDGRIVFEGMHPHTAAARIALNLRFGQPGRDSGLQHLEHLYPGADAPVTWSATPDPVSGQRHGLLDRCTATRTCPKIVQTVTDTEYWQRGMSLITADAAADRDLAIPPDVRI